MLARVTPHYNFVINFASTVSVGEGSGAIKLNISAAVESLDMPFYGTLLNCRVQELLVVHEGTLAASRINQGA